MNSTTTLYDVFLSYSMADAEVARRVSSSLRAADLQVFDLAKLGVDENLQESVMQAIAESSALVAVLPPNGTSNPNIAVEIGAALAWNKPVHLVSTDEHDLRSPSFLSSARVYPPSRVDDVIYAIKQSLRPFSDVDRKTLFRAYAALNVPTDQLVRQPVSVEQLAKLFNRQRPESVSGERLLQELIRNRKRGKLPRLRNLG
jgi:hypothetical protein